MKQNIAIIGSGMAGLACATTLMKTDESGCTISLFEKSRNLSGRLSTRLSRQNADLAFDHGAQYFHAENTDFQDWLAALKTAGHLKAWAPHHVHFTSNGSKSLQADGAEKWVFAPGMNSIGNVLMVGRRHIHLHVDCQIDSISGRPGVWHIAAREQSFGPFDALVLAMPAPQAAALLPDDCAIARQVQDVEMLGCHTLMLAFNADEAPALDWDMAHFDDAVLNLAMVNHQKPQRKAARHDDAQGLATLVVQSQHAWSQAHIEDDVTACADAMKQRLTDITGLPIIASAYDRVHRWRYASTAKPAGAAYLYDAKMGLAAIGDWCTGSKVEDAFLSGYGLATALLAEG